MACFKKDTAKLLVCLESIEQLNWQEILKLKLEGV